MNLETYQGHDVSHRALYVKTLHTLDSDLVALGSKRWELDKGAVGLHDLANLVQSAKQDAINLGSRNHSILHKDSCAAYKFVDLLLCESNILWTIAGDKDLLRIPSICTGGTISVDLGERRREINRSVRSRFDQLDVFSRSTADDCV